MSDKEKKVTQESIQNMDGYDLLLLRLKSKDKNIDEKIDGEINRRNFAKKKRRYLPTNN